MRRVSTAHVSAASRCCMCSAGRRDSVPMWRSLHFSRKNASQVCLSSVLDLKHFNWLKQTFIATLEGGERRSVILILTVSFKPRCGQTLSTAMYKVCSNRRYQLCAFCASSYLPVPVSWGKCCLIFFFFFSPLGILFHLLLPCSVYQVLSGLLSVLTAVVAL